MTQSDIARQLNKPQSFVSAYEAGQRRIDVLELIRLADAMGIAPGQIFLEIVAEHSAGTRRPSTPGA
jgi:transcriptional regulator with XRE-family HTH domain